MKAIILKAYGGVDQLEWREVPDPKPGPDEARVALVATSVNPIDCKIRIGQRRAQIPLELPAILGRDVAGKVIELGAGVTGLRVGDRVLGLGWRSYAEQVAIKAEDLCPAPTALGLAEAGALPLVVTTGAQLIDHAAPKPNDTLLVTGAVGSVGRVAVFVAKQRGARVIAGVRARQRQEASEIGADQVVALDDEEEVARLPRLDIIADTVGGSTIAELLVHLASGGKLASVLGEPPSAKGRPIEVRAFLAQPDASLLRRYAESVARGELRIPIARRFPLAEAAEAQRLAEEGKAGGKILLVMPPASA